jgi:hypothetical protein
MATSPTRVPIETAEQALNWMIDEITEVERLRLVLAVHYKQSDAKVGQLRVEFRRFYLKYGAIMGNLVALWRVGFLADAQYRALRDRNEAVLVASTASFHALFQQ